MAEQSGFIEDLGPVPGEQDLIERARRDIGGLVVAARELLATWTTPADEIERAAYKRLDDAAEKFAADYRWDDEPDDAPARALAALRSQPQVTEEVRGDLAFLRSIAVCGAENGPIIVPKRTGHSMMEAISRITAALGDSHDR